MAAPIKPRKNYNEEIGHLIRIQRVVAKDPRPDWRAEIEAKLTEAIALMARPVPTSPAERG